MVKSKKIIIALCLSSIFITVGCEKKQTVIPDLKTPIIKEYNEEGLNLLKEKFPETNDMKLAKDNIGKDVNLFKLKTIDGEEIILKQYKNKNIILDIVQAKCNSCKEPAKITDIENEETIVIPVFLNSTIEEIDEFYKSINIKKPKLIAIDDEKITMKEFGLKQTPTHIFIDKTGKISLIKQTFIDEQVFKQDIKSAFNGKKIYEYKE